MKLRLQKYQLTSSCSFISEEKVWKSPPTAPTLCECLLLVPDNEAQKSSQIFCCFTKNLVSSRYTLIKGCCQWKEQDRPLLAELSRKLVSGEKSASDKVLKAPGSVNIEQYLQEAGYGETNSYTVFWSDCQNRRNICTIVWKHEELLYDAIKKVFLNYFWVTLSYSLDSHN